MKFDGKHGKNTKGFYLALGICLLAVGIAAWTTYDSVVNFTARDEALQSQPSYQATEKTVSGVKESSSSPILSAESSKPEVSQPQQEAESAPVSSAPEKTESSQAPVKEPEPESEAEPVQETAVEPEPEPDPTPESLSYPIGKSVSQRFSGDSPVYSETMGDWRVHSGADIPAQAGETVTAACAGTVSAVSQDELYGGCVVITQGELEVHYYGVDEIAVKAGDSVAQGDAIGILGSVPCESADGDHLHLAVKRAGAWIDPLELLS